MILLKQMMVLFLMMMVGFIGRKKGILNDNSGKLLSGIVVNVANPAMILSASINKENKIEGKELVMTLGLAVMIFCVFIAVAQLLPKLLHVEKENIGVYKAMTVFSNMGFMGFPLISATYGQEALLYASLFIIPYNVLIYTYGIKVMQNGERKDETKGLPLKRIFNVGVIACILSLIIYMIDMHVPAVLENTITNLSNLTAPLSMIVIGDSMTTLHIKKLIADKKLVLFAILRLVAVPVIFIMLLSLLPINDLLLGVCLIILATPVGSMTAMLAQEYGGNYELTSKGVTFTTVLSVVTIPLVSCLIQQRIF